MPPSSFEYSETLEPAAARGLLADEANGEGLAQQLFGDLDLEDPGLPADISPNGPGLLEEAMRELSVQASQQQVSRISNYSTGIKPLVNASLPRPPAKPGPEKGRKLPSTLLARLLMTAVLVWLILVSGLVFINGGRVDGSLFSRSEIRKIFSPPGNIVTLEFSSGVYGTRAGKPVFYVRGTVENRGSLSGKVRVRAEILDGSQLVGAVETFAGLPRTPEDLFKIENSQDADSVNGRTDSQPAEVGPGQRAGFLVAFYDYPPDLGAYRLKVTAARMAPERASRR
ncbi:MAG TPA: hypothetical protein VF947_00305 [Myxococcales bacterium]